MLMDEEVQRWTARRKTVSSLEIIRGKTPAAEVSRTHDIFFLSKIEVWAEDGKQGMESDAEANPQMCASSTSTNSSKLQEVYGKAMLELRTQNRSFSPCWWDRKTNDQADPPEVAGRFASFRFLNVSYF